jgi:ParB-like chromosome segregation protein Spo0J
MIARNLVSPSITTRHRRFTVEGIAAGLHEPIVVFEDKIPDGRNRYRACEAAGVKQRPRAWCMILPEIADVTILWESCPNNL